MIPEQKDYARNSWKAVQPTAKCYDLQACNAITSLHAHDLQMNTASRPNSLRDIPLTKLPAAPRLRCGVSSQSKCHFFSSSESLAFPSLAESHGGSLIKTDGRYTCLFSAVTASRSQLPGNPPCRGFLVCTSLKNGVWQRCAVRVRRIIFINEYRGHRSSHSGCCFQIFQTGSIRTSANNRNSDLTEFSFCSQQFLEKLLQGSF
jgi:hypothetical protein